MTPAKRIRLERQLVRAIARVKACKRPSSRHIAWLAMREIEHKLAPPITWALDILGGPSNTLIDRYLRQISEALGAQWGIPELEPPPLDRTRPTAEDLQRSHWREAIPEGDGFRVVTHNVIELWCDACGVTRRVLERDAPAEMRAHDGSRSHVDNVNRRG